MLRLLLFTVYCLGLDDIFKRHQLKYHMYADDTQLYGDLPEISKFPQQQLLSAYRCAPPAVSDQGCAGPVAYIIRGAPSKFSEVSYIPTDVLKSVMPV